MYRCVSEWVCYCGKSSPLKSVNRLSSFSFPHLSQHQNTNTHTNLRTRSIVCKILCSSTSPYSLVLYSFYFFKKPLSVTRKNGRHIHHRFVCWKRTPSNPLIMLFHMLEWFHWHVFLVTVEKIPRPSSKWQSYGRIHLDWRTQWSSLKDYGKISPKIAQIHF